MEILNRLEAKFPDSYRNGNELMIRGDCMDVMAEIGEKEIPLAIVDPPYGININHNIGRRKGDKPSEYKKTYWDNKPPEQEYFDELNRVTENQIIFGGNYFYLPPTPCWILWDKGFSPDVTFAQFEMAWTSFDSSCKKYDQSSTDTKNRIHPTQKPVALYKWLLSRYAKPAELILDTHGGSGSIVIACHDLGHPIIWVEKDADYYRDAVARYKTHASQAVLFEPVEIMKEQKLFEVLNGTL